jgi:hypothetical protein
LLGITPEKQAEVLVISGAIASVVNLLLRKTTSGAVTMPTLTKEQPK